LVTTIMLKAGGTRLATAIPLDAPVWMAGAIRDTTRDLHRHKNRTNVDNLFTHVGKKLQVQDKTPAIIPETPSLPHMQQIHRQFKVGCRPQRRRKRQDRTGQLNGFWCNHGDSLAVWHSSAELFYFWL
jgi:hypothetical protein